MEVFEFVLIILTCVVASSVLDEFSRISIPVLQIIIGLIVALILPGVQEIRIDSELFLVLFIAPLLFNETREADPAALWKNRGSILSLAIGLLTNFLQLRRVSSDSYASFMRISFQITTLSVR